VTLYRCLTGQLPQEGRPASALRQGLDARFDIFFQRLCNESPTQRPTNARQLLGELDELTAHWSRLSVAACAWPEETTAPLAQSPAQKPPNLRRKPVRQPLANARQRFGLDALWRPLNADSTRFEPWTMEEGRDKRPGCVRDRHTGLIWQRGGTPYPVNHAGALDCAERLNAQGFAGLRQWRLPTAEELATLLLPEPDLRHLCLSPCFDPAQRRLWSADRKSFTASWYADAEHGFLWWQDDSCEFHARCVCG